MSDGEAILELDRLTVRYGGVAAVRDLSLEVRSGEIVGLIGPNGAGKTTLFELLGGFTKCDSGTMSFAGYDNTGLGPEARSRRGLIRSFQDAALFPTMTVVETVMLAYERAEPTRIAPALLGLRAADRRKEARARELIGAMGLHAFRNKQIRELSTGTRRITELACLVALEPKVLLLDEPFVSLDEHTADRLRRLLLLTAERKAETGDLRRPLFDRHVARRTPDRRILHHFVLAEHEARLVEIDGRGRQRGKTCQPFAEPAPVLNCRLALRLDKRPRGLRSQADAGCDHRHADAPVELVVEGRADDDVGIGIGFGSDAARRLVDLVAQVLGRSQARGGTHRTVHVHHAAAGATDQVMMVVADPCLVWCFPALGAPRQVNAGVEP